MQGNIKKLIESGEFLKAKALLDNLDYKELRNLLLDIGYDDENLCSYSFICYLLILKETVLYHCLASEILNNAFPHLIGGYESSLYHIRRALELSPDNIELKENLLFFHEIPGQLISDEEAKKLSQEILRVKPDSKVAIRE